MEAQLRIAAGAAGLSVDVGANLEFRSRSREFRQDAGFRRHFGLFASARARRLAGGPQRRRLRPRSLLPRSPCMALLATAVAFAGFLSPASGGGVPETNNFRSRKWDELRVSLVQLGKLKQPPSQTIDFGSLGSFFPTRSFGMHTLLLDDMYDREALTSRSFNVELGDAGANAWSANFTAPDGSATPKLRLGTECECALAGVGIYSQDEMAFLRLQFEPCQGCQSGAVRAVVLAGMEPTNDRDSQILQWMCAVRPHDACGPTEVTKSGVAKNTSLLLSTLFNMASADAEQESHQATMLRMESSCYDPVDYYMLGATLPVRGTDWASLMRVLEEIGAAATLTQESKKCCASISADRVVLETEKVYASKLSDQLVQGVRARGPSNEFTYVWVSKMLFSTGAVAISTMSGLLFSMWTKSTCDSSGIGCFGLLMSGLRAAVFVPASSGLTYGIAWCLCLLTSKLAVKLEADVGDALMAVPVMLSKACTPAAGVVFGAALVCWFWPKTAAALASSRGFEGVPVRLANPHADRSAMATRIIGTQ